MLSGSGRRGAAPAALAAGGEAPQWAACLAAAAPPLPSRRPREYSTCTWARHRAALQAAGATLAAAVAVVVAAATAAGGVGGTGGVTSKVSQPAYLSCLPCVELSRQSFKPLVPHALLLMPLLCVAAANPLVLPVLLLLPLLLLLLLLLQTARRMRSAAWRATTANTSAIRSACSCECLQLRHSGNPWECTCLTLVACRGAGRQGQIVPLSQHCCVLFLPDAPPAAPAIQASLPACLPYPSCLQAHES
jgi:hypothetical protein